MHKAITEFLGTFFLVLFIGLAVSGAGQFAPIAIGIGLAVLVYMGGHISGAHYNPAVTLALAAIGKVKPAEIPVYLSAQFVGGLLGAVASAIFTGSGMAVAPAKGATIVSAGSVEILFTALLVLVICNVAACARTKGNQFYGFAIGGTILAAAFAGGPISGGAFNPAVGLAFNVVQLLRDEAATGPILLYLVAPVVGGLFGAIIFKVQELGSVTAKPAD